MRGAAKSARSLAAACEPAGKLSEKGERFCIASPHLKAGSVFSCQTRYGTTRRYNLLLTGYLKEKFRAFAECCKSNGRWASYSMGWTHHPSRHGIWQGDSQAQELK